MYRTEVETRLTVDPPPAGGRQPFQTPNPMSRAGLRVKRLIDLVGASILLILFLPLYFWVALGVKLSSPGPIFYSQRRIGIGGREIFVYKFRSMRVDADAVLSSFLDSDADAQKEWDQYHKLRCDPRITKFGSFIRKTSLDELPQFWNVIRGDMSLVGPRPVTAAEQVRYGDCWIHYCSVRPGISGLWQVSGRNRLSYYNRVALDAKYVSQWSIWLDFKILVKTVGAVIARDGSH